MRMCISDDSKELINIVRHMQTYAADPLEDTLRNVFDFDVYKPETITKLGQILNHHGYVLMVHDEPKRRLGVLSAQRSGQGVSCLLRPPLSFEPRLRPRSEVVFESVGGSAGTGRQAAGAIDRTPDARRGQL